MATNARKRQSDLKHMLEQRRTAILDAARQEVRKASGETRLARAGEVRDEGDEGEAMLQDSIRFSLVSMKTQMVSGIDRALERLREGRYGVCDRCGRDIVEARLRALPFAERCRPCEELREDVERQRRWRTRIRALRVGESANW